MIRIVVVAGASAAVLLSALGSPARAQLALDFEVVSPDVRNFAGLAFGMTPDYLGSDDYTIGIAPAFKWHFDGSERYVRLLATELSINLINSRTWQFGPAGNYRIGRSDVDDEVVDRLRDIDSGVELGVFGGWTWISPNDERHRFNASLHFLHDVSSNHDGYIVAGSTRYWVPVHRGVSLTLGVSTTYGSGDYMDTFFSIDGENSARSGLPLFGASSGMRDVRISPGVVYSFSPKWHLGAGLIYSRLLSDAESSPVVATRGSADQFFGGVGLIYAW
jgi:MipA family protein